MAWGVVFGRWLATSTYILHAISNLIKLAGSSSRISFLHVFILILNSICYLKYTKPFPFLATCCLTYPTSLDLSTWKVNSSPYAILILMICISESLRTKWKTFPCIWNPIVSDKRIASCQFSVPTNQFLFLHNKPSTILDPKFHSLNWNRPHYTHWNHWTKKGQINQNWFAWKQSGLGMKMIVRWGKYKSHKWHCFHNKIKEFEALNQY